jgi:tartrate-resistant acid phosphatase type 5
MKASILQRPGRRSLHSVPCRLVRPTLLALILAPLLIASGSAQSIIVGVIGDFGAAAEGAVSASSELAVANLVKRWRPDYILTLGDNNYPNGAAATIDVNIGQFYQEFIHPYRGSYGPGATTNRFFPSLGNHDWVQNGQPSIDYFTLPGNERYYRYRAGPELEWFALNSNPDVDGTSATSVQANWLRQALTNSTARWKLVYFHHPPYSAAAGGGGNAAMRWPFKDWGASVVMAGHDHHYARLHTNGLVYFINGLGGDDIHGLGTPNSAVAARYSADFGAMRVEATATNLICQFITRNNVIVDTYILGDPLPNPFIVAAPANQTIRAGRTVQFTVQATGTPSPRYQWRSNSIALPGQTNTTLTIPDVQLTHEADYSVLVSSGSASRETAAARLTLLRHPLITTQPRSATTSSGTTIVLHVVAEGAGPLHFQWHRDGVPLSGATNAQLTLTNVALADAGQYAAHVRDDLGSIWSQTATVTVLARPVITLHPTDQHVLPGETAVWSVAADGMLPMSYSWRLNGKVLTNIILHGTTCFWALPNVQWTNAGNYQVGITNLAGPAARLTSNAFLVVLADRDNDRLPDSWETHFGLNPDDPVDADRDDDGDGASNLSERLAGTDPTSAASHLRIESFASSTPDGQASAWRIQYAVEFRDEVPPGPWQTLVTIPATPTNRTVILHDQSPAVPASRRFYRLTTPGTQPP